MNQMALTPYYVVALFFMSHVTHTHTHTYAHTESEKVREGGRERRAVHYLFSFQRLNLAVLHSGLEHTRARISRLLSAASLAE